MNIQAEWLIYIMRAVGLPYIWGGKDKTKGFDCSGFVSYALDFLGLDPSGEQNAQSLYNIFSAEGQVVPVPEFGDLLFFGKDDHHIHHIAIALNQDEMVEAAHGDETVVSPQIAFQKGARVMVTFIARMHDLYAIIRPNGLPWVEDGESNSTSKDPASQAGFPTSSPGSSKADAHYQIL